MYIGHKSEDGRVQSLKEHLTGVFSRAGEYAVSFGGAAHAARTGILHDAGKYSLAGQRRMNDPEHTPKVDHASAGAQIAIKCCNDAYGAAAITGHHGGIPNLGNKFSVEGDGTVMGRCRKTLDGKLDYHDFWKENTIDQSKEVLPCWLRNDRDLFVHAFYTHMLFSCLVDGDYLDTEGFMQPDQMPRGKHSTLAELLRRLEKHIEPWTRNPSNELNAKRCEILTNCIDASKNAQGLFTLTVPTGGGKTVSSLAFALSHAVQHEMQRVIYVIPYTSIIEQNAEVFRSILGDENVVEHHSGIEYDDSEDMESNIEARRKMLATENWDAPVIVTTAVQFFESIFSNKPSKCRKIHNIANSVVIFDEAQMLPVDFLTPCVNAIGELVRHYKVTAVLCTATQPSLNRLFFKYDPKIKIQEICQDVPALQHFFRRVHFRDAGTLDIENIAAQLNEQKQVLCIVNTRKHAQQLFGLLETEGRFHLSTWMNPEHRSKIIETVKKRLRKGLPCRLVSTSLLEAGVDLDFPQVWREKAGLDSILQAAGRCNREGKRTIENSEVVLFLLEGGVPRAIQINYSAAEIAMEGALHLDESPVIQMYFDQLYRLRGEKSLDSKSILELCRRCEFETVSENFHLIDEITYTVYIPQYAKQEDIDALRQGRYNRALMRRLGRSSVSIYEWDWKKLKESCAIEQLDEFSGILVDETAYDPECGLITDVKTGKPLFE